MKNRIILTAPSVMIAYAVLIVSVYRTTSAKLVYGQDSLTKYFLQLNTSPIDYLLPTELQYYPTDPRWTMNALEDKISLMVSFDPLVKSVTMRAHADERLVAGVKLINDGDTAMGMAYLAKSQEYLHMSFMEVREINSLEARSELQKISLASLAHRVVLEQLLSASDDAMKSQVMGIMDKAKLVYKESRVVIELFGDKAPRNIFDEN